MTDRLTGEDRCWPCTVANATIGLAIAWLPVIVMIAVGRDAAIPYATVWGLLVTGYTLLRLYALGYLPFAEPVAKATGLHSRIGPGARSADREDSRRERR